MSSSGLQFSVNQNSECAVRSGRRLTVRLGSCDQSSVRGRSRNSPPYIGSPPPREAKRTPLSSRSAWIAGPYRLAGLHAGPPRFESCTTSGALGDGLDPSLPARAEPHMQQQLAHRVRWNNAQPDRLRLVQCCLKPSSGLRTPIHANITRSTRCTAHQDSSRIRLMLSAHVHAADSGRTMFFHRDDAGHRRRCRRW